MAIVANVLVLYVSFVAVRGLLRAHVSSAEATAIGDIRTMISAQAAYAGQNDGRFEPRLECLHDPHECLPGAFHPGPEAPPRAAVAGRSRSPGVASFAYTAAPDVPGETGVRGFCGDSTALLCFTADGREPSVTPGGACDLSTCQELKQAALTRDPLA